MEKGVTFPPLQGKGLKIGIVRSQWNGDMTEALVEQCVQALQDHGVQKKDIILLDVPGSYELVFGAKTLIDRYQCDVIVPIGVLLKGETMHFEYIASAVSQGIMDLSLNTGVPIIFGVLTCLTKKQAEERSIGKKSHGYNWGLSAVQMAMIRKAKKKT
ncbi:MAG TPA: 6,7-dimethyl-8-ribityllumazine synthase [Candidatus Kapabacteria bacterium]|nr:6,7-dimethyl-8-ribityllumazine synthase [Candidatus Kapabacteria bacterium]